MPYSPPGAQGTVRDEIRIMTHGQGVRTWDAEGNEYLDGTSALEALILGHGDEEVVEAIAQQARTMSFVDVFRFVTPPQVELAAELVAASPGMAMAHFTPGGAEADEVAIKMARQYHALRGEPYRMKVITRQGAFHGVTAGAMALDGQYFASRNVVYDGGLSWGRTVPAGACPGCDFGKASRYLACVHAIEATIEAEGPETVAAVVVDPCATAIGVSIPPVGYLRDLRAVCDRHGVLLVVDEIIAGMGRTGRLFATEWDGIRPDFITLSKALSSGLRAHRRDAHLSGHPGHVPGAGRRLPARPHLRRSPGRRRGRPDRPAACHPRAALGALGPARRPPAGGSALAGSPPHLLGRARPGPPGGPGDRARRRHG